MFSPMMDVCRRRGEDCESDSKCRLLGKTCVRNTSSQGVFFQDCVNHCRQLCPQTRVDRGGAAFCPLNVPRKDGKVGSKCDPYDEAPCYEVGRGAKRGPCGFDKQSGKTLHCAPNPEFDAVSDPYTTTNFYTENDTSVPPFTCQIESRKHVPYKCKHVSEVVRVTETFSTRRSPI